MPLGTEVGLDPGHVVLGGDAAPPRFRGGAGSPSDTMWPRSRPTSIPSGILSHPAVWPQ